MDIVYADHAATSPMSEAALTVLCNASKEVFGNPSSVHQPGRDAAAALDQARKEIAGCLHGDAEEIIFTSGGTEADNQAILTAAAYGEKIGKKHLITTQIEHHAILHTMEKLEKEGFSVTYLPVDANGILQPQCLLQALQENTVMVSVMAANNEIGTLQPIETLGAICRGRGILFHSDAVQAVGHIAIDVEKMNIDMLSASAHKFHGPKGIGFLYVRKGIAPVSVLSGGGQEHGHRAGTESVPAVLSMAAALKEACIHMEAHQRYTRKLRDRLIEGLLSIPDSVLNGDPDNRLCGNVNVSFLDAESEMMLLLLDQAGIAVSSGSACTAGSVEPSYVIRALKVPDPWARGTLRFSLCEMNTADEVEYLIEETAAIVETVRQITARGRLR